MTTNVSRDQVLWYRVRQHGLLRDSEQPDVLDIGLQDTQMGSAQLALAARTTGPVSLDGYELGWTLRGAPYHHRPGELRRLAGELWPWSDTDARARLMWQKSRTVTDGLTATETYRLIAESMREVVTKPMTKGAASAEVTKLMPPGMLKACPACKSTHIYEQPFRLAALPGGLRLRTGENGLLLEPLPKRGSIPTKSTNPHGLVHRYLRFLGPATPAEVAKWLDTSTANVREIWPDDLAEVTVDGRRAWLPKTNVDELLDCDRVELVRLLPAMDPFLQARDHDLLVPDKAEQKALWTILRNPGALLVDGQIGGMWRARLAGRKSLEVTVTLFDTEMDPSMRDDVQAEAERIAEVRGVPAVVVRYA
ncbi:DNA glycosylase AlkZ-like family protein [Kutzneria sp. CA-103260]|uniref:DNA glycosylase AlkZ-like family protein n=1 Tax=Kutzneria sp. CA-103260 TaxID=2802641 RepID=UPI001BAE0FF1|nr:crosslink repair DNA glycosylase YcaQ family protein [Kutzneria sp. CA-103260]QUQ68158.1 Winged helix DNA-binding domain protein [Kutzneria sp. CA-103260]